MGKCQSEGFDPSDRAGPTDRLDCNILPEHFDDGLKTGLANVFLVQLKFLNDAGQERPAQNLLFDHR